MEGWTFKILQIIERWEFMGNDNTLEVGLWDTHHEKYGDAENT